LPRFTATTEQSAPGCRIGTFSLTVLPLAPFPFSSSARFSSSVISDRYWRTRFAADPSIVESVITVNQIPLTLIGITPPEFSVVAWGNGPAIHAHHKGCASRSTYGPGTRCHENDSDPGRRAPCKTPGAAGRDASQDRQGQL